MDNSLPTVNVGEFLNIIEEQFNDGDLRPIFGLGKGGIGKTRSIIDLAKKLGVGHIDIRLLIYSEVDLKGIPYPDENHVKTIWLQNDILPRADRDGDKGFLVFDEITSAPRSVRTAAYQLLNERRLGEYILPDGWMVICLGNGEEDGGDFKGMEGNFANRCCVFNVVSQIESWKKWGYANNINYLVLAYVSWRPSDLQTFDPDKENMLFASPRSWEAVSNILNKHPYNKNDTLTHLRILGNVGTEVGNKFIAFCKYKDSAIEPMDIINGMEVPEITENELVFMTVQGVIKLMNDMIKKDNANNGGLTDTTIEKCANGIAWMLKLKSLEHQVMAIKDFAASDIGSVTKLMLNAKFKQLCPQFVEFSQKNSCIFRR